MKTPSQEKAILAHLKSGKTLTPLQAYILFGCLRLGARIYDLRKKHTITSTMVKVGRRGRRVAEYKMRVKK